MDPTRFLIDPWRLLGDGDVVELRYRNHGYRFVERVVMPRPVVVDEVTGGLLDLLSVVAGTSYFKAFVADEVGFPQIDLSPAGRRLAELVYDDGLREFAFTNGLPVPLETRLVSGDVAVDPMLRHLRAASSQRSAATTRPLLPLGGGRDSSLVLSTLRPLEPVLLTIGASAHVRAVAAAAGIELHVASRLLDPLLIHLNGRGATNGHIPVTAINSLVGLLAARQLGCDAVVMANERSASLPTRVVDGVEVNHQFSKSIVFEAALRDALDDVAGAPDYFSALRPWGELDISAAFARAVPFHRAFMSCNRAFVRDAASRSTGWCTQCPKCRSVFLLLAPFLDPGSMVAIFGADLLADPAQIPGFADLADPVRKPFECVGDTAEAQRALGLLADADAWRDHVVVRALDAFADRDASAGSTPAPGGRTHFIPEPYLRLLSAELGPCD